MNEQALSVMVHNKSLKDILNLEIVDLYDFILTIDEVEVQEIVSKMTKDLKNLIDLGIGYLTLNRGVGTLSGGEAQKIKLAKSMSNTLNELIYIMDEPTQGLHLRDIEVLKSVMKKMLDHGNTILVIEHNLDFIIDADYIIDMGPDAGKNGGKIVYEGYLKDLIHADTYTSIALKEYLNIKE